MLGTTNLHVLPSQQCIRKEKKKIIEKVEELKGIESKEKESEIDIKQKQNNKDTNHLGKIPMGLRILKQERKKRGKWTLSKKRKIRIQIASA